MFRFRFICTCTSNFQHIITSLSSITRHKTNALYCPVNHWIRLASTKQTGGKVIPQTRPKEGQVSTTVTEKGTCNRRLFLPILCPYFVSVITLHICNSISFNVSVKQVGKDVTYTGIVIAGLGVTGRRMCLAMFMS